MNWNVEEIPELRGMTVEWAEPGRFILSRRDRLFLATSLDNLRSELKPLATVPASSLRVVAAKFRPAQRLLRFMFYNVVPLSDGSFFYTFDKGVGVIRDGVATQLAGATRAFRVLRSGCAVDPDGSVYFGEYIGNDDRSPLRIYRYRTGANAIETAAEFPAGFARHIHGVYFDAHTQRLIALTGDDDHECRIVASTDGFATYDTIAGGDETYRAVSMLFTADAMYYGTDAEHRTNSIYRIDRKTGNRKNLGDVNGTVFYSKQVGATLVFATTAENAPSQTDNSAALWLTDGDSPPQCVASFAKDAWPGGLFMFGTIHFPYFDGHVDRLHFSLVGVSGDNRTYRLRRV